jgi:hypothetical protein
VGRYVGAALIGAAVAAVAFVIVLDVANLEVTDKEPGVDVVKRIVPGSGDNFIKNPSAESGLSDWGKSDTATLTTAAGRGSGIDGLRVFRLKRTAAGKGAVSAYAPNITASPGDTVTASVYIASIAPGRRATISIDWKGEDGTYLSSAARSAAVRRDGGLAYTSGSAPEDAALATVLISLLGAKKDEALEFDAVVAEKSEPRRPS